MLSRLRAARGSIVALFQAAPRRVYSLDHVAEILRQHRSAWGLPRSTSLAIFLDFLLSDTHLRRYRLAHSKGGEMVRYTWGYPSRYEMALSRAPGGYLSHGTAAFLHGLTESVPAVLYVNREQTPKGGSNRDLTQEALNRAFSCRQRASTATVKFNDSLITLLSGKHTNRLGVNTVPGPAEENLRATSLERTLIDIVVRPAYTGGIGEVLEAYRRARGRGDPSVLLKTLLKLAHLYPYHQSVGFLMEQTGWGEDAIAPFRRLGLSFDFFLLHGEADTAYDPTWRLRYPTQISVSR